MISSIQGLDTFLVRLAGPPSLIVIGERPGMGLTPLMKQAAFSLAQKETVMYVTYHDYKEQVQAEWKEFGRSLPETLLVNDSINFIHSTLAEEFRQLAEKTRCDTLIIDDLDALLGESFDLHYLRRNHFIHDLREIVDELNIRMILCAPVSEKAERRGGAMFPHLEDITWARPLTVLADQVIGLWAPAYYNVVEDEEGNIEDQLRLFNLKDLTNQLPECLIIEFRNT